VVPRLFICRCPGSFISFFFFNHTPTTEIYTLSLHDALPISGRTAEPDAGAADEQLLKSVQVGTDGPALLEFFRKRTLTDEGRKRSEEHTSELQSRVDLVCRLLLEKKKKNKTTCV